MNGVASTSSKITDTFENHQLTDVGEECDLQTPTNLPRLEKKTSQTLYWLVKHLASLELAVLFKVILSPLLFAAISLLRRDSFYFIHSILRVLAV